MTPGFQFLGRGYDALFGNIYDTSGNGDAGWKSQVFEFTTKQQVKTPDNLWIVPDYTQSTLLSTCSVDQSQTVLNDDFDYQHSVSVGFGIDLDLFGAAFKFSIDSKHITHTTINKESIFAQLESTCAVYQLIMNAYKTANVTEDFLYGVQSLTETYDEETYMQFIQVFGTHYARGLRLGGRWGWLIEFSRNDFQKMIDDSVNWNLGLSYAGKVKAGIDLNGSVDTTTMTKVMNSITNNFSYNIGGDYQAEASDWIKSVRATPMPIKIDPIPIWELLTTKYVPSVENLNIKKALLKNATLNYCSWVVNNLDSSVNCSRPEPLPKPTPSPVSPDAVRGICIRNNGAYGMYWRLYNDNHSGVFAESEGYTAGNIKCLDGMQVKLTKKTKKKINFILKFFFLLKTFKLTVII